MTVAWKCPVCGEPLGVGGGHYSCSKRHSFDRAKEGYVNLLLANRKKSAEPGDNKAMLLSRRQFLQQGYYAPLVAVLAGIIRDRFPHEDQLLRLLDAGCGEGYYLGGLADRLTGNVSWVGTDISRAAVRMAAKHYLKSYPEMQFAVASSYDLPLPDNTLDVVVRVFAPASEAELARVLKPGGICLWVHPGERHLFELRELIYDQPQPHEVAKAEGDFFADSADLRVSYPLHLSDAESVAALLEMTPYYWSASQEKQALCQGLESLDLTVDFCVTVLSNFSKAVE